MKEAVVVLLSGGQDSTTSLYWAKREWPNAHFFALSCRYNQRHGAEVEAANEIARMAGCIEHWITDLGVLSEFGGSALTSRHDDIKGSGGFIDSAMPDGLPTSFVPGRNAFFLLTAAVYAVRVGAKHIVTGVCQTDYSGYPDCREAFVSSMESMLNCAMPSSCGPFTIHTPLMHLSKAQTVHLAEELPGCWEALAQTLTCYEGRRPGCGVCPACELRAKGFALAGKIDPASGAEQLR